MGSYVLAVQSISVPCSFGESKQYRRSKRLEKEQIIVTEKRTVDLPDDTFAELTRQEFLDVLNDMYDCSLLDSCSCHLSPPCQHCTNGYSLSRDEYLATWTGDIWDDVEETDTVIGDYERAMKVIR